MTGFPLRREKKDWGRAGSCWMAMAVAGGWCLLRLGQSRWFGVGKPKRNGGGFSAATPAPKRQVYKSAADNAAKEQLVQEGYDVTYGARPLKRTIQRRVLDPLAMRVLQGEFAEGDTIVVNAAAGALTFEKREAVQA